MEKAPLTHPAMLKYVMVMAQDEIEEGEEEGEEEEDD